MPLYEYSCRDCGERFEVLQRLGDTAEGLECPGCESSELEKQFSTFASSVGPTTGAAPAPAGGCGGGGFT